MSLIVAEVDDNTPGFERGRILEKVGQKGQGHTPSCSSTACGCLQQTCSGTAKAQGLPS